jgi:hypothetical protein
LVLFIDAAVLAKKISLLAPALGEGFLEIIAPLVILERMQ